jgi:hypothetical protein
MTPFMIAVRELLDGDSAPAPRTQLSRIRPIPEAADTQVLIRSLAEQLVAEANAVLTDIGDTISLVDDSGPNEFAFTLGYRDHSARIRTALSGRTGTAELIYSAAPARQTQELECSDDVSALLLCLLADASDT